MTHHKESRQIFVSFCMDSLCCFCFMGHCTSYLLKFATRFETFLKVNPFEEIAFILNE